MPNSPNRGFTLIELSIVLVIIGLITGGILVGRDLIRAAELCATVSQVEKYNTAANTFRNKYRYLPGDLMYTDAVNFGVPATVVLDGNPGGGDGNGFVEDCTTATPLPIGGNYNEYCGETSAFWGQLSFANLIDGNYGSINTPGSGYPTSNILPDRLNLTLPTAKIGNSMRFIVFSGGGYNFFGLVPVTKIVTSGIYWFNLGGTIAGMSPIDAYNMDQKMDDGFPNSGRARAFGIQGLSYSWFTPMISSPPWQSFGIPQPSNSGGTAPAANACTVGTGTTRDTYDLAPAAGGNDPSCGMAFRFN